MTSSSLRQSHGAPFSKLLRKAAPLIALLAIFISGAARAALDLSLTYDHQPITPGAPASTSNGTDWGKVPLSGDSVRHTLLLRNNDATPVSLLLGLNGTGTSFHLETSGSLTISPAQTVAIDIRLDPDKAGSVINSLSIVDPSSAEQLLFNLQARITAPSLRITAAGQQLTSIQSAGPSFPPSSVYPGCNFGPVAVGQTVTRTFEVHNDGDGDLITGGYTYFLYISGGSFQVTKEPGEPLSPVMLPPRVIHPGESGILEISHTAQEVGSSSMSLAYFVSNNPNASPFKFVVYAQDVAASISVTGKGVPVISGSANTGTEDGSFLGSVEIGSAPASSEFAIHNPNSENLLIQSATVSDTAHYRLEIDPAEGTPIPGGGSATLKVIFSSLTPGTFPATVTIRSSSTTTPVFTFAVSASASGSAAITLGSGLQSGDTTPSVEDGTDFGNVTLAATPLIHDFSITNSGSVDLVISSLHLPGSGFTFNGQAPITIPAGQTVSLPITFNPQAPGLYSSVVTLQTNDPAHPTFTFSIQGRLISPVLEVGTVDHPIANGDLIPELEDGTLLGSVRIGSSLQKTFAMRNTGDGPLSITGFTGDPSTGDFQISANLPLVIPAGGTASFDVIFAPETLGDHTLTISIGSDLPGNPFTFAVQGRGIAPILAAGTATAPIPNGDLTPSTAKGTLLSPQLIHTSSETSIALRNTGEAPLTIQSIGSSSSAEFTITSTLPLVIQPGESSTLALHFTPSSPGLRTTLLTLASDSLGGSYTFAVSGEGLSRIPYPGEPETPPVLTATPVNGNIAGNFTGLFESTAEARGGVTTFRLSTNGSFSGAAVLDNAKFSFKGKFDATGAYSGSVKLSSGATGTLTLQSYTGDDLSVQINGFLQTGSETIPISLTRTTGVTIPQEQTGAYTVLIPADDTAPASIPRGDGILTFTLAADGAVRGQYILADSTTGTFSSRLGFAGHWELYLALKGGGYLAGHLDFRTVTGVSDLDGSVTWVRPPNAKAKTFPAGFSIQRQAVGSHYVAATKGFFAFPGLQKKDDNAVLAAGPGAPAALQSLSFDWLATDRLTAPQLSLKLDRKTGIIRGTYTDPATRQKTSLYAVIFQDQERISGFFQGPASNGYLDITPAP